MQDLGAFSRRMGPFLLVRLARVLRVLQVSHILKVGSVLLVSRIGGALVHFQDCLVQSPRGMIVGR